MQWHDDIPKIEKGNSLTLVRTPKSKPINGIVTSEAVTGCYTHYWGGHTVPCEGDGCEACKQGVGNRWHGYVGLFNPRDNRQIILEFTGRAADPIKDYINLAGKLRGCFLQAERRGYKANSPVIIQCKPYDVSAIRLPDPPDIKRILAMIWGMPTGAIKKGEPNHYSECMAIDEKIMDAVQGPTKDSKARRKLSA